MTHSRWLCGQAILCHGIPSQIGWLQVFASLALFLSSSPLLVLASSLVFSPLSPGTHLLQVSAIGAAFPPVRLCIDRLVPHGPMVLIHQGSGGEHDSPNSADCTLPITSVQQDGSRAALVGPMLRAPVSAGLVVCFVHWPPSPSSSLSLPSGSSGGE